MKKKKGRLLSAFDLVETRLKTVEESLGIDAPLLSDVVVPGGLSVGERAPGFSLSSFFFQAEDGIRVLYVTGVQTCALPISQVGRLVGRDCAGDRADEENAPLQIHDARHVHHVIGVEGELGQATRARGV